MSDEDMHLVALADQPCSQVAAEEPCRSCDNRSHPAQGNAIHTLGPTVLQTKLSFMYAMRRSDFDALATAYKIANAR